VARAAFAACAVGVLATLSRGGIVALGLGLLARVFLGRPRGEAEGGPVATSFGMRAVRTLVFVVAAGVAMVAVEDLLNQVAKSFVEPDQWARKAVTWAPTLDLVLDHPWLGAGRGAFAAVFRAYNDAEPGLVFHYVENLPLQALADWGLPLGIGLLLAGTAAGTDLLTRCRERPLALGGAVGVLAVVIQNLADFSMEIPGVAIPTLAVLGVAVASVRPAPGPGSRPGPGVRAAMLAAATALAIPGALWAARNGPETSGARMRDVATDATDARAGSGIDAPRAWERIRPEIAAHPHDVQLVAQASRILRAAGDRDGALALARAAALLAPSYRALALDRLDLELRRGVTPEAMAALASVFADHPKDRIELWERVRKAAPARELIEALAALPDHAALWDFVDDVERRDGPAAVRAVLAVATKKRPDDADLLERMGRNATKLRDWDAADRIAVRLLARHPGRPGGPLLLGRVFHASGQLLEALAMFEEAGRLDPRAPEPAIAAMQCLLAMKRFDEFDSAAERTRPLVVRDPSWGTHLHVLKAQRQEGRGAWQAALEELRQAERLAPGDPGVLLYEAGVLEKLDRAEEAALVLRRLLRVHPDNETAARALERLRAGEGR
jgi:tetratricopeptide (TPR) repeat protein